MNGPNSAYWGKINETHKIEVFIPSSGAVEEIDLGPEIEEYDFVFEPKAYSWTVMASAYRMYSSL